MIKGIMQNGRYVLVTGGQTSVPYVNMSYNMNNSNPMQGMIRLNGSDMQVFDGSNWVNMGSSFASVGLNPEAESLLDWAKEKRNEEIDLKARMEKHPGLKDAYEKFKVMDALTLDEEKFDAGVQSGP